MQKRGVRFKMVAQQDPELTSSRGHNKSTATYGMSPSEKHLKIEWTKASTTKDKRTALRQAREAKTQTYQGGERILAAVSHSGEEY